LFELEKLIENIKKNNYNKSEITNLIIFLKKSQSLAVETKHLEAMYEIAMASFKKNYYVETILILIFCYNFGYKRGEIYEFLMKHYYYPFSEAFENNYRENVHLLMNYEYVFKKEFVDFSNLDYLILQVSPNLAPLQYGFVQYDKIKDEFEYISSLIFVPDIDSEQNVIAGQRTLLYDIYDAEYIFKLCAETHLENQYGVKIPVNLYYSSSKVFLNYLQIVNYSKCLSSGSVIFLIGYEELENYLLKPEVIVDLLLIAKTLPDVKKFNEIVDPIIKRKEEICLDMKKKLNEYYSQLTVEKILEKIKNKTFCIAFLVSKQTTALQYYIRDCHEACKSLGIKSEIIIEKNRFEVVCGANAPAMAAALFRIKPDIVLIIDHFRQENHILPKELIFICWIQDTMPHLFDVNYVSKLGDLDFTLSLYQYERIKQHGYMQSRYIDGPIPANSHIYKDYPLTQKEMDDYSTDVCIISNSSNAPKIMEHVFMSSIENKHNNLKNIYAKIYNEVYADIYHENKQYYSLIEVEKSFLKFFGAQNEFILSPEYFKKNIFVFWGQIVPAIYKDVVALWLHEKGYKMKLWGKAWGEQPVLKNYAMGVAANGETMAKILKASKISIGVNLNITLHPRIMESLFSGNLCIQNDLTPGDDWCSVRNYFKLGKELVLFKSKKDLFAKIDFYLSNEKERISIIEAGRKVALESLTYEAVIKHAIDKITEQLSELVSNK